ncbi:MAG: hypothetical protein LBU28_01440 [Spirochaetaceae bacterium]|jgi:hypothetical protein|nr:hypothetical protein [Spirochaetaceae bacterium]
MKTLIVSFAALLLLAAPLSLAAQDDGQGGFGFGFADEDTAGSAGLSSPAPTVIIGGELSSVFTAYPHDFRSWDDTLKSSLGDLLSGSLSVSAFASNAEGFISLKLAPVFGASAASPLSIDEAYARAFFGALTVEAGLRKLTWGKADSLGPLDVINPLDYRDLTDLTDILAMKISRPMLHLTYSLGNFSKLEAVFVPWFEGHRFAADGRWAPSQIGGMLSTVENSLAPLVMANPALVPAIPRITEYLRGLFARQDTLLSTTGLGYAQAGLRFTTTVGASDLGIQYYFGRLPRPAAAFTGMEQLVAQAAAGSDLTWRPAYDYNRYHQIGADYAQVIGGFNIRAELAANITEDLAGDDGEIYNPSLAWSLGFDRDLLWGINLNLQVNETIRLFDGQVQDNRVLDVEAGTDISSTRLTGILSKKFLRDELEVRTALIWGLEDQDFYILPGLFWTRGDVVLEFSGGIIAGEKTGELGQYRDNGFIKLGLTYSF